MSESAIRTEIYNIFSGVSNIGKVYDYERWAADWNIFINLFKTTIAGKDQIRGWEIRRSTFDKSIMTVGDSEDPTGHKYIISGYLGVKDAYETEKVMNALIETIIEALRQHRTLNDKGYIDSIEGVIDTRTFGSILCHCAELTLSCREKL